MYFLHRPGSRFISDRYLTCTQLYYVVNKLTVFRLDAEAMVDAFNEEEELEFKDEFCDEID